jgi:hypothetical protein
MTFEALISTEILKASRVIPLTQLVSGSIAFIPRTFVTENQILATFYLLKTHDQLLRERFAVQRNGAGYISRRIRQELDFLEIGGMLESNADAKTIFRIREQHQIARKTLLQEGGFLPLWEDVFQGIARIIIAQA